MKKLKPEVGGHDEQQGNGQWLSQLEELQPGKET